MTKLSKLEKEEISKVCEAANKIKNLYEDNSDSIDDIIFKQVKMSCEEPETLEKFMTYIKKSHEYTQILIDKMPIIKEHFIDN